MTWVLNAWKWLRDRLRRKPHPLKVRRVGELPDALDGRAVYVVGEGNFIWFVAMRCPCGCGETLQMSTLEAARPRWTITEHNDGTPSLHPSVWRVVGCRSHFLLRHGLVQWCGNEEGQHPAPGTGVSER